MKSKQKNLLVSPVTEELLFHVLYGNVVVGVLFWHCLCSCAQMQSCEQACVCGCFIMLCMNRSVYYCLNMSLFFLCVNTCAFQVSLVKS